MPPNAKAANNDKATANMRPSAVATARGKPSDFMAFSPQPGRIAANIAKAAGANGPNKTRAPSTSLGAF
jgi:hypothetical protein